MTIFISVSLYININLPKDNEGHIASDFDYKPPEIEPVEGSITPTPSSSREKREL